MPDVNRYSNLGLALLGRVVAAAAGLPPEGYTNTFLVQTPFCALILFVVSHSYPELEYDRCKYPCAGTRS